MALVPIKDLGKIGVIKDTEPALLPEGAFTDVNNVRFKNGSVSRIDGESLLHTVTVSGDPATFRQYAHWRRNDTDGNLGFDGDKVYWFTYDQSAASDPVAATLKYDSANTLSSPVDWWVDFFGGGYAIIMNNGQETPIYGLYQETDAGTVQNFVAFPGWNYTAGLQVTAKVIRPFRYSLVAANLTFVQSGVTTRAPVTIRISTQAEPGAFPQVWQPGTTADTADEFEVSSNTPIEDMLPLRDSLFLYCSDSIHQLSITNGVVQVRTYAPDKGILGQGCVVGFDNKHFVVSRDDFYIHNGSGELKSVGKGRVLDFFLADADGLFIEYVRAYKNPKFKEIWVCYPRDGTSDGRFERALIYNYEEDTWSIRDLPKCTSLSLADTIQTITIPSGHPTLPAGPFRYYTLNGSPDLVMAFNYNKLYRADEGATMLDAANIGGTWATKSITGYVERSKLFSGDMYQDVLISGLAPVMKTVVESGVEQTIDVTVTGQNVYDAAADYTNTSGRDKFTIDTANTTHGYKMEPRTVGRFLNYKIVGVAKWVLSLIGLDPKPASRR